MFLAMAEFCKKCASELGMSEYDSAPLFCEHCGKYKYSNWQKFLFWLKIKKN